MTFPGYTLLDAAPLIEDETLILMTDAKGDAWAAYGYPDGSFSDPVPAAVPPGTPALAPGVLAVGDGRIDFFWQGTSSLHQLYSLDGGKTWN